MNTGLQGRLEAGFNPFDLEDEASYARWRDWKLEHAPSRLEDVVVEIRDPRRLSEAEYGRILELCRRINMAVLAGPELDGGKDIPRCLGESFGLRRLDHNWLADDDAITSLTVNPEGDRPDYIPYTNRPIQWHTDGYYNAPDRQIHALLLYCVRPAAEGGENALLDPDLAYILLRDEDPELVRGLMLPDAMTIPARESAGSVARPARPGPVFSIHSPSGCLHMRYTARTRSIEWKDDPAVQEAVTLLENILHSSLPYILRGKLQAGWALVSNNVLHDRTGFRDPEGAPGRLLYRARYYDRVRGTFLADLFPA